MDKKEIETKIVEAISTLFEIDESQIIPNARLYEDLDLDSIDAVDLIVHLQNSIKKKVDPERFKQVRTVEDIINAIDELLNA